jgi:acyl carrier protein
MVDQTVREFITSNFYVADPAGLGDTESLLDAGVVDSTGVLEIVGFLEQRFGIRVQDDDIVPGNFDSVAGIAAYVTRKLGPPAVPEDPAGGESLALRPHPDVVSRQMGGGAVVRG